MVRAVRGLDRRPRHLGGVALAAAVGAWRLRRLGITVGPFANAIAPALLVAQAVGRIGNYFNKELFGTPTTLPWGLEIPYPYRVAGGIPARDLHFATFALYVAGYSAYRIFEETIRIDSSGYFLGLRLNMFVAIALTVVGLAWFALAQRRPERPAGQVDAPLAAAAEPSAPAQGATGDATAATVRSDE